MAIAFVATRTNTTSAAVGTSFAFVASDLIAAGNFLVLAIAVDNSGTSGAGPTISVRDSRSNPPGNSAGGNLWRRVVSSLVDPGAANEGAYLEIWIARVQYTYPVGDNIEVTFSPSSGRAGFVLREYSGVRNITAIADGNFSSGVAGTSASVSVDPAGAGQLVVAAAAIETNAAITGDADVTDGAWSAISTATSNSGTAATSMTLSVQHKIVTGGSIQNWAATWTGAADWASGVIVLDAAPAVAAEDPRGNPNYSCIAGFEGLPLATRSIPIDTGTAYQFDHTIFASHIGTTDYTVTAEFVPPTEKVQHHVAYDLYPLGAEEAVDEITTLVLPLSAVVAGANTTIVGGGTALAALQSVGGSYIRFTASTAGTFPTPTADPTVQLRFDSTLIEGYPNARILRVGLRYVGWKADTADADPGEGFDVSWVDTVNGQDALYGSWLTNDYRGDARMQTRWLGELNAASIDFFINSGGVVSENDYRRAPFTTADFVYLENGDYHVLFRAQPGYLPTQLLTALDFVEMVVEVAPDRRWATGARLVSNLGLVSNATFGYTRVVRLLSPDNAGAPVSLDLGLDWSLSIREPLPATPSDRYRADLYANTPKYTSMEAVGPSLNLRAVSQARPTLEPEPRMWRAPLNHGILADANAILDFDQYLTSLVAFDSGSVGIDGPYILGYRTMAPEEILDVFFGMPDPKLQYIEVPGGVTYDRIKFLVRPPAFTEATLTITVEKPLSTILATATVTTTQILATGTPVGEGWYEISRPLNVAITPTAGQAILRFTSNVALEDTFRVSAAAPTGSQGFYGYNYDQVGCFDFPPSSIPDHCIYDYAAVLQCELPVPTVIQQLVDLNVLRADAKCLEDTVTIPILEVTNDSNYDRLVWERSIDGGLSFDVLVSDGPAEFADYGVPWDALTVQYRVTGFRDSDRRSASTTVALAGTPIAAPGAAFGLAWHGDPTDPFSGIATVYAPVDERQLAVVWNPLNPVQYAPLHGRDYQVALRAPEERGLEITVSVLVDYFGVCDSSNLSTIYAPELPLRGAQSMSPIPFDTLRLLAEKSRIMLQLPGGHTRWVSLKVGPMTIRTASGLHIAEITLTDVWLPDIDPYLGD